MIPIYICEDDVNQRKSLESIIEKYILMAELPMKIALSTDSPSGIMKCLHSNPQRKGIYFLDIDLGNPCDGIQLARKIREIDAFGIIIMVTSLQAYTHLIFKYKIGAMDYIVKDVVKDIPQRVKECLEIADKMLVERNVDKEFYRIKIQNETQTVPTSDILFFESLGERKICLYTKNSRHMFNSTLKDIEKESQAFYHCHKSFVVNTKNIRSVNREKGEIELITGEKCPIARKKTKSLFELMGFGSFK